MNRVPQLIPDAAVVLGAAVWKDGQPSPTLQRRAMCGAQLLASNPSMIAVLSGGVGQHPPSEAQVMFDIFQFSGVNEDRLVLEDRSTTTLENVAFSAALLKERGALSVVVITDAYHLPRAKMCFRYLGFKTFGMSPPKGPPKTPWYRIARYWLRELVALPHYRFTLARRLAALDSSK